MNTNANVKCRLIFENVASDLEGPKKGVVGEASSKSVDAIWLKEMFHCSWSVPLYYSLYLLHVCSDLPSLII